jgi:hypothetical protein
MALVIGLLGLGAGALVLRIRKANSLRPGPSVQAD